MPELSTIPPTFDATELTLALELLDELDCDEQQAVVETFTSTIH